MGILDFFKKKKLDEGDLEKISFEDIDKWVDKKKQNIENSQKQPQKQIKENLLVLLEELEKKIIVLKDVDLEERKAPERAKLIVRENFNNFIYHLEKLIMSLKNLDTEFLEILINKINLMFSEFEKKSITSFQKSTFLIGKELEDVGKDIAKFFKSFNKIINENKFSIEQRKKILIVERKLKEFYDLNETENENRGVVNSLKKNIDNFENKIYELKKKIEDVKAGEEYIEQTRAKQNLEAEKTKLLIEIQNLKELIDFKELAKIYHSIEEKMSLVKEYKDDFEKSFEKYGSEKLLDLIDIKAIDKELVEEKIGVIKGVREKIEGFEIGKDLTGEFVREIESIQGKIGELNFERLKVERTYKRLEEHKERIKQEVIDGLKDMVVVEG